MADRTLLDCGHYDDGSSSTYDPMLEQDKLDAATLRSAAEVLRRRGLPKRRKPPVSPELLEGYAGIIDGTLDLP